MGEGSPENNSSLRILWEMIQGIYIHELSAYEHIKNRSGIFIAFLGVLLGLVTSNIKDFIKLDIGNINKFFFVFLGVAFLCLLIAIVYFIRVVSIYKYPRVGLDIFSNKHLPENMLYPEKYILEASIRNYAEMCPECVDINKTIAKKFQIGTWFAYISLICFSVSVIIIIFPIIY